MTKSILRNAIPTALIGMALLVTIPVQAGATAEGRWKVSGSGCVFDPNDDGPNQCDPNSTPPQTGRWKISGDSCVLDPNDSGPDQCSPAGAPAPAGRFKLNDDGSCYFDAGDSGPNQCSPSTEHSAR